MFIEGFDGAVIRDVLILTDTNQSEPDETDDTVWNLTARVYFDVAPTNEIGTLTLKRLGSKDAVSVPVRLSSRVNNDPQDVTVTLKVRILMNLKKKRFSKYILFHNL